MLELNIKSEIPLVDEILANHRERIGVSYQAYRNHVGLSRKFVKKVSATFPNHGFHKTLIRLTVKQSIRSPLNPLPMIKW